MTNYWWVNQNQTFNHEVGGGYLWSPKSNANGAKNQFYDNMALVEPGDIVFSFAGTFIKAIGIATSSAFTSIKPIAFGSAGSNWNSEGWRVNVEFKRVDSPIRPKEHMQLLGPLLPSKYSPLQQSGDGLQGVYLAAVPSEMASTLLHLLGEPEFSIPLVKFDEIIFSPEDQEIRLDESLAETTKATLVQARRGQGIFRNRVEVLERECRVTGVNSSKFLIASHIKPWKDSDNAERLDGNNGLFLSPHIDRLFDGGFITFTEKGQMLVSETLDADVLDKWNINPSRNYGRFNTDQAYFLEYHKLERFKDVA